MGCYDMVVGKFVCPYCGTVDRVVLNQTKAGRCDFIDFGLGDNIPGYYSDGVDEGNYKCEKCNQEYGYKVGYYSGCMGFIKIYDRIFNKTYTYKDKKECVSKTLSEEELKDMSEHLKNLKNILEHNSKKIKEITEVNQNVTAKMNVLKNRIEQEVSKKYGLDK